MSAKEHAGLLTTHLMLAGFDILPHHLDTIAERIAIAQREAREEMRERAAKKLEKDLESARASACDTPAIEVIGFEIESIRALPID